MESNIEHDKEAVIHSIQQILQSHYQYAIDNCKREYPHINPFEIAPIVLSRFIYTELFVLARIYGTAITNFENLFVALLKDLIKNNYSELTLQGT